MSITKQSPLKQRLDRTLTDHNLTPTQKLVLTLIILHLNTRTDTTTISNPTLARKLGLHPSTITRTITQLANKGYIYRKQRWNNSCITHYADIPNGYIMQQIAAEYDPS